MLLTQKVNNIIANICSNCKLWVVRAIVANTRNYAKAVLLSHKSYLRYQQMEESEVLTRGDNVWERLTTLNAEFSKEEFAADIKEARNGK